MFFVDIPMHKKIVDDSASREIFSFWKIRSIDFRSKLSYDLGDWDRESLKIEPFKKCHFHINGFNRNRHFVVVYCCQIYSLFCNL